MRFVQLLLTEDQAELAAAACRDAEQALAAESGDEWEAQTAAGDPVSQSFYDAQQLGRLALLFRHASESPLQYPPTGKMATTVRSVVRRAKGAAQPKPLNKRKQRQERRMRTHKERRRFQKEITASYNAAREQMEAERLEAEQYWHEFQERIEKQAKFKVVTADGRTVVEGVPAEFVIVEETGENLLPKVVLP